MLSVVLEDSNRSQLVSVPYLLVHSLPEEDHDDTDDASRGRGLLDSRAQSTVYALQSSRHRRHCASGVDRHAQAQPTLRLDGLYAGVPQARGSSGCGGAGPGWSTGTAERQVSVR
jgi:hypothetical protein